MFDPMVLVATAVALLILLAVVLLVVRLVWRRDEGGPVVPKGTANGAGLDPDGHRSPNGAERPTSGFDISLKDVASADEPDTPDDQQPYPELPGEALAEDLPTLARTLIEQGEELQGAGKRDEARTALRRGLEVAHRLRDPELEALARLNLGDVAREDGDLTTACEHWQLARELFAAADRREAQSSVEERMRETRCPTDWVLTDF